MSSSPLRIRTRFAPSPTGYLHLGGARTALYSWAFARHHKGDFILRIEDTDLERSTPEAVQAIMDGMHWLELDYDEGPFFQMQRMERYKAVISEMLTQGSAYLCYSTPAEVEAMREAMRARGEKPRYDGTWRPEPGKQLGVPPADAKPVIRFRNPQEGDVTWQDMVKGSITISNRELDDLIIARPDGTPTYNFCVVVDDWDMKITHVIRGDDHINNTPRQINILKALGGELPVYGHLPMILGPDGEKLSKRHGAVSVTLYDEAGFLPDAMVNYLARLGWSHGDDELFSREQLVEWFDADHLSKSAAQFNPEKLAWVNAHYMKQLPIDTLCEQTLPRLNALGFDVAHGPALADVLRLVLERANTLVALAQEAALFYRTPENVAEKLAPLMDDTVAKAIADFAHQLTSVEWSKEAIAALIKTTLTAHGLKMPKLAMPLRVLLTGETQTPSVDALMTLLGRERVVSRLTAA
ncbi:MAG: glutamate--tRNA ligase [Burkholderiales bacterium]|jgi:glutamyl-tRNA synthetase|nr:glutamate--tRNA ligase [Burkholderiales bacterium]